MVPDCLEPQAHGWTSSHPQVQWPGVELYLYSKCPSGPRSSGQAHGWISSCPTSSSHFPFKLCDFLNNFMSHSDSQEHVSQDNRIDSKTTLICCWETDWHKTLSEALKKRTKGMSVLWPCLGSYLKKKKQSGAGTRALTESRLQFLGIQFFPSLNASVSVVSCVLFANTV